MSKIRMIHYQCKYCGRRGSKLSTTVPQKTQSPKRPKGQMHIWARTD